MVKSILQTEKECYFCGRKTMLECHHVFPSANRKKSEQYGLKLWLCHSCHNEPPNGVHFNKKYMLALQQMGQQKAMEHYGWTEDEFRKIFGKSYL